MTRIKCIVCGKKDAQIGVLCTDCFVNSLNVRVKDTVGMVECPKCGAVKLGKRWIYEDFKPNLIKKLKEAVHTDQEGINIAITTEDILIDKDTGTVTFPLTITKGDETVESKLFSTRLKITKESCPRCNKLTGSYYEAIIQIRSYTLRKGIQLETAMNLVKRYTKTGGNGFHISKIVELHEGYDIYLMSKSDGNSASQIIHDNFFSYVLPTKKLAGREGGSDLYRYTYLVRILDLEPGEIISNQEKKFIVTDIKPSRLTVVDVDKSVTRFLTTRDFFSNNYMFQGEKAPLRRFILISSSGDESEIMDSTDFKMFTVKGRVKHDFDAYLFRGKIFGPDTAN